jgi:hypothetical protein
MHPVTGLVKRAGGWGRPLLLANGAVGAEKQCAGLLRELGFSPDRLQSVHVARVQWSQGCPLTRALRSLPVFTHPRPPPVCAPPAFFIEEAVSAPSSSTLTLIVA